MLSRDGANRALDALIRASDWIGLHTADPEAHGGYEVVGGRYSRQSANGVFGPAADGSRQNVVDLRFTGMPAVTVTHFSVWDSQFGGKYVWGGILADAQGVLAGWTALLPAGSCTATFKT